MKIPAVNRIRCAQSFKTFTVQNLLAVTAERQKFKIKLLTYAYIIVTHGLHTRFKMYKLFTVIF